MIVNGGCMRMLMTRSQIRNYHTGDIWRFSKSPCAGNHKIYLSVGNDISGLEHCSPGVSIYMYVYIYIYDIWVNYNDLTATSLEIMVNKGNHPQMALIQVSEILQFTQILCICPFH